MQLVLDVTRGPAGRSIQLGLTAGRADAHDLGRNSRRIHYHRSMRAALALPDEASTERRA
jgi:hypothetical protein